MKVKQIAKNMWSRDIETKLRQLYIEFLQNKGYKIVIFTKIVSFI